MMKKFISKILPSSLTKKQFGKKDDDEFEYDNIGFILPQNFHEFITKNSETKTFLMNVLRSSVLFMSYSIEGLNVIVDAFEGLNIGENQIILSEGSDPGYFYIMQSGRASVFIKDKKKKKNIKTEHNIIAGMTFGEMAFINNTTRSATIITQSDCVVWRLNGPAFKGIITHKWTLFDVEVLIFFSNLLVNNKEISRKFTFSKMYAFLKELKEVRYNDREILIPKDHPPDTAFIIYSGEVYSKENTTKSYRRGDVLGEKNLLNSSVYEETFITRGPVICYVMKKDTFYNYCQENVMVNLESIKQSSIMNSVTFSECVRPTSQTDTNTKSLSVPSESNFEMYSDSISIQNSRYSDDSHQPRNNEQITMSAQSSMKSTSISPRSILNTPRYPPSSLAQSRVLQSSPIPPESEILTKKQVKKVEIAMHSLVLNTSLTFNSRDDDSTSHSSRSPNPATSRSNLSTSRSSLSNNSRSTIDMTEYNSVSTRTKNFLENSEISSSRLIKLRDLHKSRQTPIHTPRISNSSLTPRTPMTPKSPYLNPSMFQNMTIKDLEMIRVLGIGGFGKVRLVKILETDQLMVLKTQSKKAILAKNMEAVVINEIQLMREMHHPYIAKLYGAFQDKCYIHMALELLQGGDFFGFLKHQNKFPEEKSIFYSSVVILALEALHSVKIAYRDLKPENLVFDKRGYIKLVDFGLAKRVKSGITWTLCGTPDYMAPEIVNNKGHGCPVDWWALGTIIYEMIDGYPPFYHSNQMKVYQRILSSEVKFSKHFSPDCRDFLTKLLNKNQTQRLGYVVNEGITEIQKHPWFRSIDWKKLLKGTMVPPFVPELKDPLDTSYFEEYEENVNDMYDSSQEVDWEANLELTLMERRRAELAHLSNVWNSVRKAQLSQDDILVSNNKTVLPVRSNSWALEERSTYAQDMMQGISLLSDLTVDDSVLVSPRRNFNSLYPITNNEVVRESLSGISTSQKKSIVLPDDLKSASPIDDIQTVLSKTANSSKSSKSNSPTMKLGKISSSRSIAVFNPTPKDSSDLDRDINVFPSATLFPQKTSDLLDSRNSNIPNRLRRWSVSTETPRLSAVIDERLQNIIKDGYM